MQVAQQKVVSIDYTLTGPDGNVIDSSQGREPLAYLHGAGAIIPGLERELEGKTVGDELSVSIDPVDGYGERSDDLVQAVPRDQFEGIPNLQVGMQLQAQHEGGIQIVTIAAINDEEVTVDANHPLAGIPLKFDVKVTDVRDATADELSHGHVHTGGDHDHDHCHGEGCC